MNQAKTPFDKNPRWPGQVFIGAPLANVLRELSLTPRETKLAIALFQGQSVGEYASQAGISINTARWHVKHIYDKAGVNRQTKLIHALLKRMSLI